MLHLQREQYPVPGSSSGWSHARQLGITFNRPPDIFISLQLPPPDSRSICIQYLLRHRHRQNVFELALSERPSECAPRLPEASLSTEHPTGSEQLRSSTMPEGERSPQGIELQPSLGDHSRAFAARPADELAEGLRESCRNLRA
jgi:hypothetical protein